MPFVSSRRILVIALGGAALLSALPQSFQTPWSGTLAGVLWAPLVPGASVLAWARDRVRAPAEPYQGLPEELRAAREDRDRLQGELDATQMRVEQLVVILGARKGMSFWKGLGRTKVMGMERISACIVLT
jgi:hypothetical protein